MIHKLKQPSFRYGYHAHVCFIVPRHICSCLQKPNARRHYYWVAFLLVCICREVFICRMSRWVNAKPWSIDRNCSPTPYASKALLRLAQDLLLWWALVIAEIDFTDILMATYLAAMKALNCDLYITDSAGLWQHFFRSVFIMRGHLPPRFRPSCPEACGQ